MARTKEELLAKMAEDVVEMEDEDVVDVCQEYIDGRYHGRSGTGNEQGQRAL